MGRFSRLAAMLGLALPLLACGSGESSTQRIYDLSRDPTPEKIAEIREYLDAETPEERAAAMFKLVDLEVEDSLELALDGLDDPEGFVRATAATLLGELPAPRTVPRLVTAMLEDPDPVVRQRAAESLAALGGDEAERALVQGLEDPLGRVRLAATRGLVDLAPGRGLDTLMRLVVEDPDWEIRAQAAHGLGRAGDPRAVPVLEQALDDRNEFVRAAASNALDQLEGAEAS